MSPRRARAGAQRQREREQLERLVAAESARLEHIRANASDIYALLQLERPEGEEESESVMDSSLLRPQLGHTASTANLGPVLSSKQAATLLQRDVALSSGNSMPLESLWPSEQQQQSTDADPYAEPPAVQPRPYKPFRHGAPPRYLRNTEASAKLEQQKRPYVPGQRAISVPASGAVGAALKAVADEQERLKAFWSTHISQAGRHVSIAPQYRSQTSLLSNSTDSSKAPVDVSTGFPPMERNPYAEVPAPPPPGAHSHSIFARIDAAMARISTAVAAVTNATTSSPPPSLPPPPPLNLSLHPEASLAGARSHRRPGPDTFVDHSVAVAAMSERHKQLLGGIAARERMMSPSDQLTAADIARLQLPKILDAPSYSNKMAAHTVAQTKIFMNHVPVQKVTPISTAMLDEYRRDAAIKQRVAELKKITGDEAATIKVHQLQHVPQPKKRLQQ